MSKQIISALFTVPDFTWGFVAITRTCSVAKQTKSISFFIVERGSSQTNADLQRCKSPIERVFIFLDHI
jgi:hypothetical protein